MSAFAETEATEVEEEVKSEATTKREKFDIKMCIKSASVAV